MIIRNSLLSTVACVFLSLSLFAQATKPVKLPSIPREMNWENKPLNYKVSGNAISITAGKETDIYGDLDGTYYVNNVPRLLFTPDSNFIFSAKVSLAFNTVYDGGAIILYSDSSTWAKLLFELNDGNIIGVGSSLVRDKLGDDSYHVALNAKQVFLKAVRSGKTFCFYYSLDGKKWSLLRTFTYPNPENLKIGFYAQSPKGNSSTVNFSEIKYRPEKFKDFLTGE